MRDLYGPAAIIAVIVGVRMAGGGDLLEQLFQSARSALSEIPQLEADLITKWFRSIKKGGAGCEQLPPGVSRRTLELWREFLELAVKIGKAPKGHAPTDQVRKRLKIIEDILKNMED